MFGLANVRVCLIQLDFSVNRLYYNRNLELINVVQNFYGRFQHESCSRGISQGEKKRELLIFITADTGRSKLRQIYERAN